MKNLDHSINIAIPNDVFLSISLNEELLAFEMKKLLAFKLFAEGRLSSGKAAKLAGVSRISFLFEAGEKGIEWLPFSQKELERELAACG